MPCGMRLTMPAKMMKLMPLPMPRSVMSSPSHIVKMVPAVRVMIWVIVSRLARLNEAMTGVPPEIVLLDRMAR